MAQTLHSFDVHAPDAHDGAQALWAQMRDTPGLVHCPNYGGYYIAARYEDALAVLTKPDIFTSAEGINLPPARGVRTRHIPAETDAPEHRDYRALMAPRLSARYAESMEPGIREIVRGLIGDIPEGVSIDFVRVFARKLPILVSLDLMGLPRSDAHELEGMVEGLHREVATRRPTGAADRLKAYSERVAAERRRTATDADADVVSAIVLGTFQGRSLSSEEQMSMVRQILTGAFDTTAIAMATMMKWLAETPTEAQRLRDDPAAIDLASEEIVRFASPSTYLRREVTQDTILAGTSLKKGDSVLIAFGAANHDPAKFACPDQVVATRKPNMHIGFGAGHHRCVGSLVAKTQLRIAMEELLTAFASFRVGGGRAIQYTTGLGQGIGVLPMILTRA